MPSIAGDGDLFVAGGVESMSRAPLVMAKPDTAFPRGNQTMWDTTLGWRFPNPRLEAMFPLESMGETGENVAERYGVSREEQDAFALESQRRWAAASEAGRFDDELVPVGERDARRASAARHDAEKLAALRPAFRADGTVTAGNSSGLNDGAAALVIASEERARELGAEPLGAFVGSAVAGVDPRVMGIGPVPAVRKLLERAGVSAADARPRRAERGVRVAEPRRHPRARPRSRAGERERRRDRDRPSARDERRAARRHAAARAAPPRRPLRARHAVRRRRPGAGGALHAMTLAVERYLELALRLGKPDDELVEAYHGPPELAERVAAEEPRDPQRLRDDADSLLADLADGRARARTSPLAAKLRCARCTRRRGASAARSCRTREEVELLFGISPALVRRG